MTPDNAIWWLKLKAKQKQTQKYEGPIYQGHPLPVTDITAEPIGKGKYLAEFDKQNPRQEYKETNEYIRIFQPEKVVQKQAWRDAERNRLRNIYAESYMIRDKVKATLNPKNWGVPDYTDKGSKGAAYSSARKAGEKEFMWNNTRYSTLNSGTASQQFNMYGNTNAMVMSKAEPRTKEKIFKNSFVGNNMDAEALERSFVLNTLSGTPSYKNTAVHPEQEQAYANFRKQPLEKSKKELMDEYKKIGSSKIRPRYNAFTNTIYGNSIIAETAHAYRNTEKSEILSFIKDYIKFPFFSKKGQLADYTNREHFEFDTHSIVEPILDSYLSGEIEKEEIPLYIKKLREQNQNYLSDKNNPKRTFNINDLKLYYPYNKKSNKYKISKLQKELFERGYQLPKSTKEDGTFDGVWGDETEGALLDYQSKNK